MGKSSGELFDAGEFSNHSFDTSTAFFGIGGVRWPRHEYFLFVFVHACEAVALFGWFLAVRSTAFINAMWKARAAPCRVNESSERNSACALRRALASLVVAREREWNSSTQIAAATRRVGHRGRRSRASPQGGCRPPAR